MESKHEISFLEFVEKFFPEQVASPHRKEFIKLISEQLQQNPKHTVIVYDGRGSRTKSLLNKYQIHNLNGLHHKNNNIV